MSTGAGAPAPRLTRLPVPVRAPRPARRVRDGEGTGAPAATQGTLALALPLPGGRGGGPDTHRTAGNSTPAGAAGPDHPGEHLPAPLPEPREWALTFAQAATEVAAGVRSPAQLLRWTSMDVHAVLARRGALAARARRNGSLRVGKPQVRSVLTGSPRPGVVEVAAVVADQDRVRALAFRMEGQGGRWRVTALESG